jgi:hypothetical protein
MGRAIGGSAEKARRLADAQGVDDVDGHALAGFIEAEGSFEIRPNNGGNSWICGMALTQRADDADMRRPTTFSTGTPDSFVTFGVMSTSGTRQSRQSPKRPA